MKKFFMLVAFASLMLSNAEAANTMNVNDFTAINYKEKVDSVVKKLSLNNNYNSFYNLDLSKDKTKMLRHSFGLNDWQTEDLMRLHDTINKKFDNLSSINDSTLRKDAFDKIISYWRKHSNESIVLANYPNEYFSQTDIDNMKKQYRLYWACVVSTLRNRGIVNSDDEFNYNLEDTKFASN